MLKYTSCLFASIVIHAYYARLQAYHHLFLTVTVLSILNHCTYIPAINALDRVLAHAAFIFITLETPLLLSKNSHWLLCFPACCAGLWLAESMQKSRENEIHAALHALSVAGVHAYMHILH